MITLTGLDTYPLSLIQKYQLRKAVRIVLRHHKMNPASIEVTINLTGDDEIQELNNTYRQVDAPTDVLSFESDMEMPDSGRRYLGDIIISHPTAAQQAHTAGHTIQTEILILVVHGILHLLGYDHAEPDEKLTMWNMQNEIFRRLRIHPKQLPEK